MRVGLFLTVGLGILGSSVAGGVEPIPTYDFEWATIGDPGNPDTTLEETSYLGRPGIEVGSVDYLYRLAVTEVTVGQYFEFVVAYLPYYEARTGNSVGFITFTGLAIHTSSGSAHIVSGFSEDQPADMGWEYAARYCNWLHNGKVVADWAFDTGVYDTSTFTQNPDGSWNHQAQHHPDAHFWIPSLDEWTKGGYWDPEKNDGEGGYWQFPTSSDIEPVPGHPDQGGERNAGSLNDGFPLPVGSYPHIQSPWGLLDMAGGQREYTEDVGPDGDRYERVAKGTSYKGLGYGDVFSYDLLGSRRTERVGAGLQGFRLAGRIFADADLDGNGRKDFFDVSQFIVLYQNGDTAIDYNGDGLVNTSDIQAFLDIFFNKAEWRIE